MKIEDLLTRLEGKTLEFKQDLSAPRNILKTVTAFANTAGGILLVGIEDGTRAVVGVKNPLDEEERLCSLIADSIEPRLAPGVEIVNWKGRTLLAVEVYPSALRPHWLKAQGIENGVLVRVGSTNRQADGPLTAELRRSALNLSYDEEPIPDIDPDNLDVRVASGLFAGFRQWNDNTLETLRLRATFSLLRDRKFDENPVDMQILACVAQHQSQGGASIRELVEVIGLVDRSVRRHLARLIKTGHIVAVGKSAYDPNRRYLPA